MREKQLSQKLILKRGKSIYKHLISNTVLKKLTIKEMISMTNPPKINWSYGPQKTNSNVLQFNQLNRSSFLQKKNKISIFDAKNHSNKFQPTIQMIPNFNRLPDQKKQKILEQVRNLSTYYIHGFLYYSYLNQNLQLLRNDNIFPLHQHWMFNKYNMFYNKQCPAIDVPCNLYCLPDYQKQKFLKQIQSALKHFSQGSDYYMKLQWALEHDEKATMKAKHNY